MLETFFRKIDRKVWLHQSVRDYASFSKDSFLTDLSNSIEKSQSYETFEIKTADVLDKHAPQKQSC